MDGVTQILSAIEQGDPQAADKLLPLVYEELRKLAAQRLSSEKPGQTLAATALVHEAYIRLVDADAARQWNSRGHFFAAAAEAMRRILVENARRKGSLKHGGQRQRVELDSACAVADSTPINLLALDEALSKLAATEPAKVELVKLRFFAGLTMSEAAAALGISLATAERYWTFARGFSPNWPRTVVEPRNSGVVQPQPLQLLHYSTKPEGFGGCFSHCNKKACHDDHVEPRIDLLCGTGKTIGRAPSLSRRGVRR